ncbi:MAG: transglutaminase family protein [Rikenellaceae bacterium]
MKRRYRYSYQTIERYDSMVTNYHFQLRCTPYAHPFQRLISSQLQLLSGVNVCSSVDTFGNTIDYGTLREPHDLFVVSANGVVECDDYMIEDSTPSHLYRTPTRLTAISPELSKLNLSCITSGTSRDVAELLSHAIFRHMSYTPCATTVTTTAAESFTLTEGVCQDFSHILIALCRERAIFVRYVVGYVIGTGETHAWVEVWSDGVWYGIDPTHDKMIEGADGYIKVAHGRDAADCSVVRGMRQGITSNTTQIRVMVEEMR